LLSGVSKWGQNYFLTGFLTLPKNNSDPLFLFDLEGDYYVKGKNGIVQFFREIRKGRSLFYTP
jgi:hypothetical protein